jgi:dTDP-4-dehydrorhamnose 3,5-epimerase
MKVTPSKISGAFTVTPNSFSDDRGSFVKTFHEETFKDAGIIENFKESFYSVSKKNVIRGMHFHLPPKDHAKLVYVTKGRVLDVTLDLRKDSPTYGQYETFELSDKNHTMLFIPTGCAHGFLSLEDDTCMVYLQTGVYSKDHDTGIAYDSFGFKWEVEEPILSERDRNFQALEDFDSPF